MIRKRNSLYCPVCFNNTLQLQAHAVAKLSINGVSKDNSLFVVNIGKDTAMDLDNRLKSKVDELLSWYGNFQNKQPIHKVEIHSADCKCMKGCVIRPDTRISLINLVYPEKKVEEIIKEVAKKYKLQVTLTW